MGRIDKPEKNDNLIKYGSILLARSIKIAQKETDLFPSRFFVVFLGGWKIFNYMKNNDILKSCYSPIKMSMR